MRFSFILFFGLFIAIVSESIYHLCWSIDKRLTKDSLLSLRIYRHLLITKSMKKLHLNFRLIGPTFVQTLIRVSRASVELTVTLLMFITIVNFTTFVNQEWRMA